MSKYAVLVRIESAKGGYERTVEIDAASDALAIAGAVMLLDAEGIQHVTVIKATKVLPS